MPATYKILIMGASYGSLLASKILYGGHSVHLVCLPAEADLINAEGFRVRMPVKGRKDQIEIDSRKLPGKVSAGGAAGVNPKNYDLVGLAMQEPQYRSPGVRELLDAVAKSKVPCMSIMNMPPLPYVKRIPGLNYDALKPAYTDPTVWDNFEPGLLTLCSPDPQAIRPPEEKVNVLQVTLPTNFKVARFDNDMHTGILRQLEKDNGRCCWRVIIVASPRTACARRKKLCIRTSRSRVRSTTSSSTSASSLALRRAIWCRSKNTLPRRKVSHARLRPHAPCRTVRPISNAPTSWCS
jgi:hypothetical protein